jgi:secreted PhoX family phosphatase
VNTDHPSFGRRNFFRSSLAVGAGLALAGPFGALGSKVAEARPGRPRGDGGYGPLYPVRDDTTGLPLLLLPRGFEYLSYGWTNDPMSDGAPTPSSHDGMAAFRDGSLVRMVRNHERGTGRPFGPATSTYDPAAAGGTTNLLFDPDRGEWLETLPSLSGTIRNCAGGPTSRDTWLSCEETTAVSPDGTRHGYVFEVPSDGVSDAVALKAMGRFSHEAAAEDPATGYIYETEDTGSSALYRFRPSDPANLAAGGVLEAMRLTTTADTAGWNSGDSSPVAEWVLVDNPDWAPGEPTTWQQASAKGAARIVRGEGAWYGNGVIYVVSTSGGPARQGQVFAYDPAADTFTCVFASPSADVLNAPDNVCVSPRGGLVLCEDGDGLEFLHGLSATGDIFKFAQNNVVLTPEIAAAKGYTSLDYTGSEWAGATFEPRNGNWLFVNLQSPGITFAITGPWRNGAL